MNGEPYIHALINGVLSYLSYLWGLGFGGAKRWWDALKSPFGVTIQATRVVGDNVNGEEGFPLCNNGALRLYFKSYWVL